MRTARQCGAVRWSWSGCCPAFGGFFLCAPVLDLIEAPIGRAGSDRTPLGAGTAGLARAESSSYKYFRLGPLETCFGAGGRLRPVAYRCEFFRNRPRTES